MPSIIVSFNLSIEYEFRWKNQILISLRLPKFKEILLEFNNMEVFLYRKEFLDEYFKVQKIFNTELIVE